MRIGSNVDIKLTGVFDSALMFVQKIEVRILPERHVTATLLKIPLNSNRTFDMLTIALTKI